MMNKKEFDVVVVGAGAAGLMSAIVCARHGLDVLVIEKSDHIGGSAALSGGAIWAPGNAHSAAEGQIEDPEQVRLYLRENLGPHMDGPMVDAFLSYAPAAMDFLACHTSVKLQNRRYYPDYRSNLPGAALGGRVLEPLPFDGRQLGASFDLVRPPLAQFTLFGGMMINGADINALLNAHRSLPLAWQAARLIGRYCKDRLTHERGTRLTIGNALVAGLLQTALSMNIEIHRRTALEQLHVTNGRVDGLLCRSGGESLEFRASRAVVLASGGFSADASMRQKYIPHAGSHYSLAASTNTGDGIRAALAIGAKVKDDYAGAAFLAPVSILQKEDGREELFPHLISDRQKPGLIAVNEKGRRFVNEASSYHDFVLGMYRDSGGKPSVPAYLVCDSRFIRKYGLGFVKPRNLRLSRYVKAGYLYRGRSAQELAVSIGIDTANFEQALLDANRHAADGKDPDFGKGSTAYERLLGDIRHLPNPCLGTISKPPFYAVRVWPGDLGSALGLETDTHSRVLDQARTPMPGLYACGADMHSVMSGTYPAAGITLGPALTFGFICGESILDDSK